MINIPNAPATALIHPPPDRLRLPGLRGLSALALVLVVLFHASGGVVLPGGFVGFSVFFVVAGYLMTGQFLRTALRERTIAGRVLLAEILAHQARTLLPMATLVLLVVAVATMMVYPSTEWEGAGIGVLVGAFFITNWWFAGQIPTSPSGATGTLELPINPLLHYWAIAVEFQFFILWTAILMVMVFFARPQSSRGSGRSRWRIRAAILRRNTAWAAIVLTAASLGWTVLFSTADQGQIFFHTSIRMGELGIGAILGVFATQLSRIPQVVGHLASGIGLVGILGTAVLFDSSLVYPGYSALIPALGAAALMIGTLVNPGLGMGRILDNTPVRWLGEHSLAIYLWHWPVLVIGAHLLGTGPTVWQGVMLVAASVIPAWLSHHFIAQRVLRWPAANRTSTNTLSMGVLLLSTCVLAGLLLLIIARG